MSWLSFFSEITKALAWPIASMTIALLFRAELTKLLHRIKKGKVGPAEFEFEEEVRTLGEGLSAEMATSVQQIEPSKRLFKLADVEPRSAIISAWLAVEKAAFNLAKSRNNYSLAQNPNPIRVIRDIERNDLAPKYFVSLFHELRALRNQAAHEPDFTPSRESVINYIELSELLISVFEAETRAQ